MTLTTIFIAVLAVQFVLMAAGFIGLALVFLKAFERALGLVEGELLDRAARKDREEQRVIQAELDRQTAMQAHFEAQKKLQKEIEERKAKFPTLSGDWVDPKDYELIGPAHVRSSYG